MKLLAATRGLALVFGASVALAATASAQQPELQTCTQVHSYCLNLCANGTPTPPPTWTCDANRCIGLQECLTTGEYRMGTQFGHHPPARSIWGPFQKK